ncbi:MAG: hypothetical protein M0T75_00575 [Chloroflexi bacterium]|nr:hypothetical protein [Chloroflexota bacterium]
MPILGLVTRFALAAVIGLGGALAVGAATAPPASSLLPAPSTTFELTADTGDDVVPFGLTSVPDATPVALTALPDSSTLQLVAFVEPGTIPGGSGAGAGWLLPGGHPRVPAISQFDGGPLASANCTMASGAMLARLGFGIVATGSQLRAQQADQEGGTSLSDLEAAIGRWSVSFNLGAITPLQLRALLYAGAGAVVQVSYERIPASLRLQADFTGGHAVYLDGFRAAGIDGPAGYYVIDPLGPTWAGYRGAWWPADVVEAAALDFGGGAAYTAWAFPGGTTPANPPALPAGAFPGAGAEPGTSPGPSASPGPSTSPGASASPAVTSPPLPTPAAPASIPPSGDTPPATPPDWWFPHWRDVLKGGVVLNPILTACVTSPPAAWCPAGIIGVLPSAAAPTLPPLKVPLVDLLYANPIGGDLMQVIFRAPDGATPFLQYWDAGSPTGQLHVAPSIEAALLDGAPVQVATFPIAEGVNYHFVASAQALGLRAISEVGTAGP